MPDIVLLNQETIDKIAAGEVVERPCSVVKELVENAIDAKASAVTVEIKEGGISLIRITDNGCGIPYRDVPTAFLRHSTSKIRRIEDLLSVSSLGFRGEALSSISAVARVELITKTKDALTGARYRIEGSKELGIEEIGAPDGSTFLVRDLFYNTPARRKFLKTAQTEGTYISDMVEKLSLSHPEVSFKYINNNQTKLHTSGNGSIKDLIYHIFGRDITASLLEVDYTCEYFKMTGYIGKPVITRGNRNYENYFINGRYIKSQLIAKAIEEGYRSFLMQHQYPFTVLYFDFPKELLDVNVHPSKMELRFEHNQEIYKALYEAVYDTLSGKELIPTVPIGEEKPEKPKHVYTEPIPEPFEKRRLNDLREAVAKDSPYEPKYPGRRDENRGSGASRKPFSEGESGASRKSFPAAAAVLGTPGSEAGLFQTPAPESAALKNPASRAGDSINPAPETVAFRNPAAESGDSINPAPKDGVSEAPAGLLRETVHYGNYEEQTLASFSPEFLTQESRKKHRIIGQLFATYWLVQMDDKLFIIDQHAAHEKVLYERTMALLEKKEFTSQLLSPPIILSLDAREEEALKRCSGELETLGYRVEHFGGKEYAVCAVPGNLFHMDMKELFIEMLDDFSNLSGKETPQLILEKVASMSCKAAVKGSQTLSRAEAESLIDELLTLENPYNCPHGRPTIIAMTRQEIEKKFKRIVS